MKYLLLILFIFSIFGCSFLFPKMEYTPKIAFSFDDQHIDTWYPSLKYLKEKYSEFTATLFVTYMKEMNIDNINKYIELHNMGFEIGAHNVHHENSVSFLEEYGEEKFINLQLELKDFWFEYGIEIKSFAYPYGKRNEQTDLILKDIYSVIRKTSGVYSINGESQYIGGFNIDESISLDKEGMFLNIIKDNKNSTISSYGHAISEESIGLHTSLYNLELWIKDCIKNKYQFINVSEINPTK